MSVSSFHDWEMAKRIHYKRPEWKIGLCWEATRAPTPGPKPDEGRVIHTRLLEFKRLGLAVKR
jgi:hypothetical protein